MADQTFHTPNFGDEEFDIPPIALPHSGEAHPHMHHNMSYSMGMHGINNQGQHQQHYAPMYLPEHMATPMTMNSPVSYGGSPPTYTNLSSPHTSSQNQMGNPQQQHMMLHHQQGARPPPQNVMGTKAPPRRSPNTSTTSPPNPETASEDSDDSVPQTTGAAVAAVKRPSPEPDTRSMPTSVTPPKKQKAQKKKKKRDPNEPQKPVSAYALFFRDTQAAIKGQNPNASFGEVSKIVASMWDALDVEHKNVYKKKTEAAKKEYLKALAAYRASLVSKGAPTESPDGTGMYPPPNFSASMSASQHFQQPQSFYGNQQQSQQQQQPQPKKAPQSQQSQQSMPPPANPQQQHGANQQQSPSGHPMMQQMSSSHHLDTNQYSGMGHGHSSGYMNPMGDGGHGIPVGSGIHMGPGGSHGQHNPGTVMNHMSSADAQTHSQRQMCVRNGCSNVASTPMEADMQGYDEGYCSSQCVVSHCRDVFSNWVSNNQAGNSNYGNGMKFSGPGNSGVVGADGLSYVT